MKINNHFYLVKNGTLVFPSKFQSHGSVESLSIESLITPWGLWLPFGRGCHHIESIIENTVYTMDGSDIIGLMLDANGNGVHIEICGSVIMMQTIMLDRDFDIRSNVVGIPEIFKTIQHIRPSMSGEAMVDVARGIIPIYSADLNIDPLDELRDTIAKHPRVKSTLKKFVKSVRKFHAQFNNDNTQYVEKFKVDQA